MKSQIATLAWAALLGGAILAPDIRAEGPLAGPSEPRVHSLEECLRIAMDSNRRRPASRGVDGASAKPPGAGRILAAIHRQGRLDAAGRGGELHLSRVRDVHPAPGRQLAGRSGPDEKTGWRRNQRTLL